MHNPSLLHHCNAMVQNALLHGGKPVAFLMSAATRAVLSESILFSERQRRSAWQRFKVWFRGEKFELTHLLGVPVIENPHLEEGFVSLQVAVNGYPQGMAESQEPGAALTQGNSGQSDSQNRPGEQENPFMRREQVEPDPANEDRAPTLTDLAASTSGERPTASAILMKAMDNADALSGVVIIRVYPNNDLDMCCNVDSYTAQGILQKASVYLMQRGQ